MKNRKYMLIMLFILSFMLILPLNIKAASYSAYKVKYKCKVRTSASDKVSAIKNGNDDVTVYPNQELEYIKTVKGPNNGKNNQDWYAVKFDYAARGYTGYVAKACMYDTKTYSYNDDSSFEQSISSFPNSYKPYLRKLHAIHPNWTFKMDNTNLDWASSVTAESQKGQSSISYLYPSLFYRDSENPNGIIVDGKSWYAPCYDAVGYYLDPRNFLTEKNIFMFESLVYNEKQNSSVQGILNGSFMEGSFSEEGYTKKYADAFIEAAKTSGVSSTHLASRALQEMGTKMSSAASGTVSGYEGYYNFYNIGAYSGENNYILGLQRAVKEGWNTRQKAITGGALFIANKYVNNGKDTLYFQKFNVSSKRKTAPYTYEYMTNIMAPSSESASIYSSYEKNGKLGDNYTFTIPVYNNMTSNAYKVSRTDTVGGNETDNGKTEENNNNGGNNKPEISPETKVSNAGYSLETGYITKVNLGEDMSSLRQRLSNASATAATLNSSWNSKTSGAIATGDIIEIDSKKTFQVVVYGDINGDANISVVDLLFIKKYILGEINLAEPNKKAADINKDGKVDVVDLLLIKKYLLQEYNINQ